MATEYTKPAAAFSRVPVVNVTTDNWAKEFPNIKEDLESADFVAIDCVRRFGFLGEKRPSRKLIFAQELSGLGDRKKLNTESMEERYMYMSAVAKTRSIIGLGISCFRLRRGSDGGGLADGCTHMHFAGKTYNLLTLCSEDYIVEPGAVRFLVQHGFDFNAQYSRGLPYYRGVDREVEESVETEAPPPEVRDLLAVLVRNGTTVVLHNGIIDLVFIYQVSTKLSIFRLCSHSPFSVF